MTAEGCAKAECCKTQCCKAECCKAECCQSKSKCCEAPCKSECCKSECCKTECCKTECCKTECCMSKCSCPATKVPRLVYYDAAGRAEGIRLAFRVAGKEFEDVRFGFTEGDKFKANSPTGQFPYLEVGGHVLCQSAAILAYVCGVTGQVPVTVDECAACYQITEDCEDILKGQWQWAFYQKDEAAKDKEMAAAREQTKKFLHHIESCVTSKDGFALGHATMADFKLTATFGQLTDKTDPIYMEGLAAQFPVCARIHDFVVAKSKETPKPDAKPEAKPEGKPEGKPQATPECKPQATPECKPDCKPECKGECKPESSAKASAECKGECPGAKHSRSASKEEQPEPKKHEAKLD